MENENKEIKKTTKSSSSKNSAAKKTTVAKSTSKNGTTKKSTGKNETSKKSTVTAKTTSTTSKGNTTKKTTSSSKNNTKKTATTKQPATKTNKPKSTTTKQVTVESKSSDNRKDEIVEKELQLENEKVEKILNEILDADDEKVTSKTIELKEMLNNIFDRDIRESKEENTFLKKNINFKNPIFINFFLFPLFLIIFSDLFFKVNSFNFDMFTGSAFADTFLTIYYHFKSFLFIYLIFIILNLFVFSIFNKDRVSKWVLGLFILLLTVINDVKVLIMNTPLHFSDVNFLNASNGDMAVSFLGEVTGKWVWLILIKILVFIGVLIVFVIYSKRNPYKFKKGRLPIIVVSFILFLLPFVLVDKIDKFVLNNIYETNYDEIISVNDNIANYYNYGLFQGVYYDHTVSHYAPDSSADPEYIEKKVSRLAKEVDLEKWGKPNVVFILSESLSDLERIAGYDITFDKELMSNIRSYQNDSDKLVLDLLVTPYGGMSVNTEFQILTGGNLNFLPADLIAYTQLYNDNNGDKIPNLIKEYNNNGYITKYITPWAPDSYKSGYVYDLFGVDEKIYGKDMKNRVYKGPYVSDEYLTDYILNELKKDSDESKFLFVASGQNHMPCSANRYSNYDVNVVSSVFNEENTGLLRCYAQGVYDADKQLNRLYEEIQKLDEPTIVVLYGDHLPYIVNREARNIYFDFSYFKTDDTLEYDLRTHTTPAVILSNYGVEFDDIDFMDSSYLGAYVLNHLDLEISDYFKYIYYNLTTIPVFNRSYLKVDDTFVKITDLDEAKRSDHTFYRNAQQYYFNNYE